MAKVFADPPASVDGYITGPEPSHEPPPVWVGMHALHLWLPSALGGIS